jgi:hypothetical protein
MIVRFKETRRWPVMAVPAFAVIVFAALTRGPVAQGSPAPGSTQPSDPQEPPRIVSTSPRVGETEVDPKIAEITVTFDRDMSEGFSWTGGGSEYPPSPEGAKARWVDKRTCVFPVKLELGRYYNIGINSVSYQNFKSAEGVPVAPSAIYFTTKGASQELKRRVSKPRIIRLSPLNGAKDVDPGITELRVTFNVPMSAGFSWTGGGPEYPPVPEGKKAYWTDDHLTCVLPVQLQPGTTYRLGLNSPSFKGFQSAGGMPLDPVIYGFTTKN